MSQLQHAATTDVLSLPRLRQPRLLAALADRWRQAPRARDWQAVDTQPRLRWSR
jgi:hypothetical protein